MNIREAQCTLTIITRSSFKGPLEGKQRPTPPQRQCAQNPKIPQIRQIQKSPKSELFKIREKLFKTGSTKNGVYAKRGPRKDLHERTFSVSISRSNRVDSTNPLSFQHTPSFLPCFVHLLPLVAVPCMDTVLAVEPLRIFPSSLPTFGLNFARLLQCSWHIV